MVFQILGWIIFGLIVGVVAKFLVRGEEEMGLIPTTLLGIAGSFVGGYIGQWIFGDSYSAGLLMSILGAIVLLLIYKALR